MKVVVTTIYRQNEKYLHDDTVRMICNRGGSSSSKTVSILQLLLMTALKEKCYITIVGETTPKIKKTTWKDFHNIVLPDELKEDVKINKSEMTVELPNGSVIAFLSAESESRVRGLRTTYVFFDEINSIKREVVEQITIRTKKKIFAAWNPSAEFWLTEEINERDDFVEIISTYKDNPFLEQAIIDELEARGKRDENFRRVFILGLYGSADGLVFAEGVDWQLIDTLPQKFDKELWAMDFGFTDPSTLFQIRFINKDVYIKEWIYESKLLNNKLAPLIKECNPENIQIVADSADPKSISDLRNTYGIKIKGIKKEQVLDSINNLKKRTMFVTKDSLKIIKDLRNYHWSLTKKDKKGRAIPDHNFSHSPDTIRYGCDENFAPRKKTRVVSIKI